MVEAVFDLLAGGRIFLGEDDHAADHMIEFGSLGLSGWVGLGEGGGKKARCG